MNNAQRPDNGPDNAQAIFDLVLAELAENTFRLQIVAAYAEVSPSTLYRWLRQPPTAPQLRTVLNVARELGLEITVRRPGSTRHLRSIAS